MLFKWKILPIIKNNLFMAKTEIAKGYFVAITYNFKTKEQTAELDIKQNGLHHKNTFHRTLDEKISYDDILKITEPWIMDEIKQYLNTLQDMIDNFKTVIREISETDTEDKP